MVHRNVCIDNSSFAKGLIAFDFFTQKVPLRYDTVRFIFKNHNIRLNKNTKGAL